MQRVLILQLVDDQQVVGGRAAREHLRGATGGHRDPGEDQRRAAPLPREVAPGEERPGECQRGGPVRERLRGVFDDLPRRAGRRDIDVLLVARLLALSIASGRPLGRALADVGQRLPDSEAAAIDDDAAADDTLPEDDIQAEAEEEAAAEPAPVPTNIVRTPRASEPSLMDRVMDILGSTWLKIIAGAVLLAGVALWFLRRSRGDDDDQSWETLDSDEIAAGALSATETLQAPRPDESFVVEEQGSGVHPMHPVEDETIEVPAPEAPADTGTTGQFDSLEDTFSSETAVNLDQTDPLAEADFHMAYGLYDQAADLVNGALESEPERLDLLTKLCEIYFVWGNRDAFVDAARRVLADAPGVVVYDDPERGEFPTPNDVVGTDPTWVGRLRQHQDDKTALELFVCGDNLRKGAALNTAQIAEVVAAELSA